MSFTSPLTRSRWRDVYLVAAVRAVSSCGNFMAVTTLVLMLQPVSGYAVSALILASSTPVVVLAPVAGRLADRVDSRVLLIVAGSVQVCIALVLVVTTPLVGIIALMALLGAGQAVIRPALGALVPSMVRHDHLPRASAINQTASMLGILTGPALGGVLVGLYGARLPLLLNAASLIAIVLAGVMVKTRRGGAASRRPDRLQGATAADQVEWGAWRDPLLRAGMISLAVVVGAIGALNVVDVFLVRDTLGASAATYGLLEAVWTGGMLVGTWLLARMAERARDDGALVYGLLMTLAVMSAMLPLAASVGAAAWLVPLWIIAGCGNGGLNVYSSVLVARRAPEMMRGRAYATYSATIHGAGMAGYAAGGPLVEVLPVRPVVAGLGLVGLASVGLLVWPVRRMVRRGRIPTPGSVTN